LDAKIIYCDDAVCIAHWYNVQILNIPGLMTVRHLPEVDRAYKTLARAYPGNAIGLGINYAGGEISDAETRTRSAAMIKEWGNTLRHLAMVLEGGGVWAAAMRTVIRGMTVMSRASYTTTVHDSVAGASRAVGPIVREVVRPDVSDGEVIAAVDQVREAQRSKSSAAHAFR
jgi:hypothetical protein